MADSGKLLADRFTKTEARAKALNAKVEEQLEGRDISALEWGSLASPDVSVTQEGECMGRPLTKEIVDFIIQQPSTGNLGQRAAARMKYITGMPGCGKTVSVSTAVAHLHVRTAKALREIKNDDGKVEDDKKGQDTEIAAEAILEARSKWEKDAKRRVMLISAEQFRKHPEEVLYKALIMAYINDPEILAILKELASGDLRCFVEDRNEELFFVVDDANALDDDPNLSAAQNKRSSEALQLLEDVADHATVIICASMRSKWRKLLEKTPGAQYKLVCRGFDDLELPAFLSHYNSSIERVNLVRTGKVPRLLHAYIHSKLEFKKQLQYHEKVLRRFIRRGKQGRLGKLLRAAVGARVDEFTDVLDTKCFYRGPDGKAECLTEYLRSRAFGWISAQARRMDRHFADTEIRQLTAIAEKQTTTAAVGVTAEAAAILVLQLREPTILLDIDLVLRIKPQAVRTFRGGLTKAKLMRGKEKILYVPLVFNHTGVDVYYEDEQCIVAFQITVGRKPVDSHPNTRSVAMKLFQRDPRTKVLVWVIVPLREEESCDVEVVPPSEEDGTEHYEVFMPFTQLDGALDVIENVVSDIRGSNAAKDCAACGKREGETIECTKRDAWFHSACFNGTVDGKPVCPDCAVIYGVCEDEVEEEEFVGDDDFDFDELESDLGDSEAETAGRARADAFWEHTNIFQTQQNLDIYADADPASTMEGYLRLCGLVKSDDCDGDLEEALIQPVQDQQEVLT